MKFIKYLFTLYPLKWVAVFAVVVAIIFGVYDHFNGGVQWWIQRAILFVYIAIVMLSAAWELVGNRKVQRKPWNR